MLSLCLGSLCKYSLFQGHVPLLPPPPAPQKKGLPFYEEPGRFRDDCWLTHLSLDAVEEHMGHLWRIAIVIIALVVVLT